MRRPRSVLGRVRRVGVPLHRDLGYFRSSLVFGTCLSGLALNHVDEWNPDFVVHEEQVDLGGGWTRERVDAALVEGWSLRLGEGRHRIIDFPTPGQVKVYYQDATLLMHLDTGAGAYERVSRRPLFYEVNVLHRNGVRGWKWASDVFAVVLMLINGTGLVLLKGRNGLSGRGAWLIAAGFVPPVAALLMHELA